MITISDGASLSVELPNPTFGDDKSIIGKMVVRYSLNGTIRTYVSTTAEKNLSMTISNIKQPERNQLQSLFDATDGLDLVLTNYDSVVWDINITNMPFEFVEFYNHVRTDAEKVASDDNKRIDRRYSVTINFKGKPQ